MAAGHANRVTDLLLMDPSLGELAGQVKPQGHRAGPRPDDPARLTQGERGAVLVNLPARPLKQVLQNAVAQSAGAVDPPLILRGLPIAEWAGHSVDVLLRVYAKCISGQHDEAKCRIGRSH